MPCLNEEAAIGVCIEKINSVFQRHQIDGEIVVCDNGSTDRSVEIAESMGVRVVHQPVRGYGSAYLKGFAEARGQYLIMADADDTYDFNLIPDFLKQLVDDQIDFVTGSRYLGGGQAEIKFLHRVLGNPLLTLILNIFFGCKYTDVYCGYRGFSRRAYDIIRPVSPGMEFNLELAINAKRANLSISEIPIVLSERIGESKLNTFRDGWRSLRLMLLYSPNHLFLIPGLSMFSLGMIVHAITLLDMFHLAAKDLDQQVAVLGTMFSVLGVQTVSLWLHAKTYSWSRRFEKENTFLLGFYQRFTLETGLLLGTLTLMGGITIIGIAVYSWMGHETFVSSNPAWLAFAATLIMVGMMINFTSLFISAMSITHSSPGPRSV